MEKLESTQQPKHLEEGILESFDPELKRALDFADQKVDPSLVDYKKIKMHQESLKLSGDGSFFTLQGEGPTMGLPAIFLRLHVCNLKCTWCDAWYTWNPHTPEYWTEPRDVSIQAVVNQLVDQWPYDPQRSPVVPRLVMTGGEPLIQRKQLELLMRALSKHDWENRWYNRWVFEVETNGTLMPTDYMLANCKFNVSPKLDNSDNASTKRIRPNVIETLSKYDSTFKFVVTSPDDLEEIKRDYLPLIRHDQVIIMPQGVSAEEVDYNAARVAEACKDHGFRLLGRLQTQVWGAKRGV